MMEMLGGELSVCGKHVEGERNDEINNPINRRIRQES